MLHCGRRCGRCGRKASCARLPISNSHWRRQPKRTVSWNQVNISERYCWCRDDAEAVRLANQTEYGLAAAVLSPDLTRAQRIADQLPCGIIHINDQTILHEVYGPIGGHGVSGNGYSYSTLTNTEQFTEWQWITSRETIAPYPF